MTLTKLKVKLDFGLSAVSLLLSAIGLFILLGVLEGPIHIEFMSAIHDFVETITIMSLGAGLANVLILSFVRILDKINAPDQKELISGSRSLYMSLLRAFTIGQFFCVALISAVFYVYATR